MAAIYSNGGNRWNILGFNFTKRVRYLVYIRYLWAGANSKTGYATGLAALEFRQILCGVKRPR